MYLYLPQRARLDSQMPSVCYLGTLKGIQCCFSQTYTYPHMHGHRHTHVNNLSGGCKAKAHGDFFEKQSRSIKHS